MHYTPRHRSHPDSLNTASGSNGRNFNQHVVRNALNTAVIRHIKLENSLLVVPNRIHDPDMLFAANFERQFVGENHVGIVGESLHFLKDLGFAIEIVGPADFGIKAALVPEPLLLRFEVRVIPPRGTTSYGIADRKTPVQPVSIHRTGRHLLGVFSVTPEPFRLLLDPFID